MQVIDPVWRSRPLGQRLPQSFVLRLFSLVFLQYSGRGSAAAAKVEAATIVEACPALNVNIEGGVEVAEKLMAPHQLSQIGIHQVV